MNRRWILRAAAAAPLCMAGSFAAGEQRPVKILAGFAPGTGVVDVLARLLADKMKGDYAPTVIVENRPGAGGQLAVAALKAGASDGSLLLVSPMSNMSLQPHIFAHLPYDPFKDVVPVGNCATSDLVIAVGSMVPQEVRDVPSLMQWYKANPIKASFATGATGSKLHFAGMKLGIEAGVPLTHVGYTNGGTALTDLAGGAVPAYIGTVASVLPFVSRVRVLATMGQDRSRFLTAVPTLVESGYSRMVVTETVGLYAPSRTSDSIVGPLRESMKRALTTDDAKKVLTTAGVEVTLSDGKSVTAKMKDEFGEWGQLVKQIGFKAE